MRHEIVLATDSAHDLAIGQRIGDHGAEEGRHHRRVDKPCFDACASLGVLVAVKLIDEADRFHLQLVEFGWRHFAQRLIEGTRASKESGMQERPVDLALENPRADQVEKTLDEHLAATVEAGAEGGLLAGDRREATAMWCNNLFEHGVVRVPQDQCLCYGVAERADAELQRAAIGHKQCRVQARGVLGEIHRLAGRRKHRKIGLRRIEHEIERIRRNVGIAGHERHVRIGLRHHQQVQRALAPKL